METVNIHEAKTQLSRLWRKPAGGGHSVIAKGGKAIDVKVTMLDMPKRRRSGLGLCPERSMWPKDFDSMGAGESSNSSERRVEISSRYASVAVGCRTA